MTMAVAEALSPNKPNHDDDDEMSVSLVEETGVPAGNHGPTCLPTYQHVDLLYETLNYNNML